MIHPWCFRVSCLTMSGSCIARAFTSQGHICHPSVGGYLSWSSISSINAWKFCCLLCMFVCLFLFLLFVAVNCCKIRMRHFTVVRMQPGQKQPGHVVCYVKFSTPFVKFNISCCKKIYLAFLSVFQVYRNLMFSATGSVLYSVC